jgi:hypothetical protein
MNKCRANSSGVLVVLFLVVFPFISTSPDLQAQSPPKSPHRDILQLASTNVLTSSENPSLPGDNVTFTATVSAVPPATGTPTGTVQFRVDGAAFGPPVGLVNGVAATNTSALAHGAHLIASEYGGDVTFGGSSNTLTQVVNTTPVAGTASFSRLRDETFKFTVSQLLTNATDADGDTRALAGVSATSTNGAVITTDGTYVYYDPPTASPNVADSFTYTVSDTFGASSTGPVLITIAPDPNTQSLNIISITTLPDGNKRIGFAGIANRAYVVQFTTNLLPPVGWTTLATNMAGTNGLFEHTDLGATNSSTRFYRTAQP